MINDKIAFLHTFDFFTLSVSIAEHQKGDAQLKQAREEFKAKLSGKQVNYNIILRKLTVCLID